ncbi:MAG: XdhC family protein [Proteobacteria bacterium]|nr:XdhC family protein [Pseudomonadota bacterium]
MMNLYGFIEEYLKEGRTGTLATIVNKLGAAPREEGAKMFVGDDGRSFGTVGGGSLEAEVYREILDKPGVADARMLHFRMDGKAVEEEGMLCGGDVDVFLEPVLGRYRDLYKKVRYLEQKGKQSLIITRFGKGFIQKTIVGVAGEVFGDPLEKGILETVQKHSYEKKPVVIDGIVIEPTKITSLLYIFGAGHVSQYLSKVGKMLEFNVVVIDDREAFANRERFLEADSVIVEEFDKVFERLNFSGNEYIVIVTRGHQHDALVLEQSLQKHAKYIGMIGSKRKVKIVLDHLKKKGFSEDVLKTVHAPIGIDIHSETPQEIAISIVAELIKVRGEL